MKVKCNCGGMPETGRMCMYVIVGGEYCGYKGSCKYQETEKPKLKSDTVKDES